MLTWDIYCTEGEEGKEAKVSKPKIHFFLLQTYEFSSSRLKLSSLPGVGWGYPAEDGKCFLFFR